MTSSPPPKPIRSLRESDPEIEERLDGFIATLGERIDHLQDAEAAGEMDGLRTLGMELARDGDAMGYPALVAAVQRVIEASGDAQPEATHKALVDLTELAQRVRRGHRSAA